MWSHNLVSARASSVGNPITQSVTLTADDKVLVVLLKVVGATNRAGGAPTWGAATLSQANSTQKAATSPEASAELWYLLNPGAGTNTLTIPNTGALTVFKTIASGRWAGNVVATFIGANGGNNTSTNPTPGAVTLPDGNAIGYAVNANGATTWAPSARAGVQIADTDDGADGGGEQYILSQATGSVTLSWTFGTSDDWGAVAAFFGVVAAPLSMNNYIQAVKVPGSSGISVGERID